MEKKRVFRVNNEHWEAGLSQIISHPNGMSGLLSFKE